MQNPTERPCPECGGQRIVCTTDPVYKLPTAWDQRSFLAVICTNCGYSSFFAQRIGDFSKIMEKNSAGVQKGLQENAQKLTESQNWRNKK